MTDPTPTAVSNSSSWHARAGMEVLAEFRSREEGLTGAEATERLLRHGPNTLPKAKGEGPLQLLWRQVNNPLIYVLLGSAVLALLMGKGADGLVVLAVVILNTLIGFVQEYRAGKAIEALSGMVPETATALRDGQRVTMNAADLVPGDIVALQSGDKVPADMRLITCRSLQVEESALTGESVPVEKSLDLAPAEAMLGDRRNMVYSGSLVTYGAGTAVIVATSLGTELGRISSMLHDATQIETPLTRSLAKVGKWLTIAILVVSVLMFGVGIVRGYTWVDATLAAITLAVAAIPEGLPAIITIALAIGVQRMAKRRAVIRRLPAVETLGSTTVICSDKTGTLTKNEMTVQEIWTPSGPASVVGIGYEPVGEIRRNHEIMTSDFFDIRLLLQSGLLCNDANLVREDGMWKIHGDPTEGALVVAARKIGLDPETERTAWPRMDAIPFESENQYMATLHQAPNNSRIAFVKGAPEVVLRRCDRQNGEGTLDPNRVKGQVEELASQGMRVLALAAKEMPAGTDHLNHPDVEAGLTLLGLQGMIDPPRAEAIEAIRACHQAGITVKMITGDHRTTASAIGRQLGILDAQTEAVPGTKLQTMSDAEIQVSASDNHVFARVAPEHKLRLVRGLQAGNHVVAMTGDGVNDAPALKQANIGVAMGITGTAVSKEASDIVLTDDNFATIAAAVEEGRRVYDNLVKSLAFVLPTNLGEALILLIAVMLFPLVDGQPLLPMLPTQILWINLVATVALALPLAFEAMEPDVMRRPPREPGAPIMNRFVVVRTVIVSLLMTAGAIGLFLYEFYGELARMEAAGTAHADARGLACREAQTMAVTTVVLFQIFYLLNCRSLRASMFRIGLFSNPYVYLGILALVILQAGFIYLPFMNRAFGSAPLSPLEVGKALLLALTVLPVIGIEKWIRGRRAVS